MRYILILLLLWGITLHANLKTITDDTYISVELPPVGYEPDMTGTNLIPVSPTDVELKKIHLKIKSRNYAKYLNVKTDYLLFNPSHSKNVVVEFDAGVAKSRKEAFSPSLFSITFKVNGKDIHDTRNQVSVKNGSLRHIYLFDLALKEGKNHIMFEYTYRIERDTLFYYKFKHNLKSFSKWTNKKIEKFVLDLDVGRFQALRVSKGFFEDSNQFKLNGKIIDNPEHSYITLYTRDKNIHFETKNFTPRTNLYIESFDSSDGRGFEGETFDAEEDMLSFKINETPLNFKGWKADYILRALPYARRGYVFKRIKGVQDYFESLEWYTPNINLKRKEIKLTGYEKKILKEMLPEPIYNEKFDEWMRVGNKK